MGENLATHSEEKLHYLWGHVYKYYNKYDE